MNKKIKEACNAVLAQEKGAVLKEPEGKIRIALAYPNSYYVGMSNLGIHAIYQIINNRHDALVERVFLPSKDIELIYKNSSTPLLTLESQIPVKEFDILAFSCSFENDYLNCLKIMDLAGIPLWSKDRDEKYPLVIMGGACTFFNTEPMAPFVDCFICGEGEGVINEFLDLFRLWLEGGGNRHEFLLSLLNMEGIYSPRFYEYKYDKQGKIKELFIHKNAPERISPRIEKDIDMLDTSTVIFTHDSTFGHMFLLEVSRGCPRGCHFCLLSQVYKPFRKRSIENLLNSVKRGLRYRSRIGLVGASLTDYNNLSLLCESIISMGGEVSLCSLRIDDLSDRLLGSLAKSGVRTITLAPEAGSQRLRSHIGKADITDEKIMAGIEQIIKWGIPNLKLYFIAGLPDETEEDLEAIVQLVKRIRHHACQISKGKKSLRQITVSISSFIPKPLTRLQFSVMESIDSLNKKVRYLAKELGSLKMITCIHDVPKWAFVQALLSRGDRRIAELLHLAFLENGNWNKAFKQLNINPSFYLYRSIEKEEIPPWSLWMK